MRKRTESVTEEKFNVEAIQALLKKDREEPPSKIKKVIWSLMIGVVCGIVVYGLTDNVSASEVSDITQIILMIVALLVGAGLTGAFFYVTSDPSTPVTDINAGLNESIGQYSLDKILSNDMDQKHGNTKSLSTTSNAQSDEKNWDKDSEIEKGNTETESHGMN